MRGASPGPVQRAAYRVWLAVGVLALLWIGWRVLAEPLAVVVPPLLLATVIVYLLTPIVSWLQRRGVPRLLATALAYVGSLLVLAAAVAVLVPLLTEQIRTFAQDLPNLIDHLTLQLDRQLRPLGLALPDAGMLDAGEISTNIERALEGAGDSGLSALVAIVGGLSGLAFGLFQLLLVFALGPVIAFYVLVDLPRLGRRVRALLPPHYRAEAAEVGQKLHEVVGGFIRGQLLVALFVGLATSLGLGLIGLPFWLLIGVLAGVTNVIPLLGPFVAGALGVSVALVTDGFTLALLVLAVMVVVQQLDNQLISPLVMGRNVHVHPLVVLLALLVAGTVYGIFGLLIAVPAVAAANVLAGHVWQTRVPWAGDDGEPVAVAADRGAAVDLGRSGDAASYATDGADRAADGARRRTRSSSDAPARAR